MSEWPKKSVPGTEGSYGAGINGDGTPYIFYENTRRPATEAAIDLGFDPDKIKQQIKEKISGIKQSDRGGEKN